MAGLHVYLEERFTRRRYEATVVLGLYHVYSSGRVGIWSIG
jgi:hypothetical protein